MERRVSLWSTKHFLSFTEKQCCSMLLNKCWGDLKNVKKLKKLKKNPKHLTSPYISYSVSKTPKALRSQIDLKRLLFKLLLGHNLDCSCVKLKALASRGCFLKTSPHLHQLFRRMMQHYCLKLWSSRNVLWATKLPLIFHHRGDEDIMTEFSYLGELMLNLHRPV